MINHKVLNSKYFNFEWDMIFLLWGNSPSQNCPFRGGAYEHTRGKMFPRSLLSGLMPTSKWFGQLHGTISSSPLPISSPHHPLTRVRVSNTKPSEFANNQFSCAFMWLQCDSKLSTLFRPSRHTNKIRVNNRVDRRSCTCGKRNSTPPVNSLRGSQESLQ